MRNSGACLKAWCEQNLSSPFLATKFFYTRQRVPDGMTVFA